MRALVDDLMQRPDGEVAANERKIINFYTTGMDVPTLEEEGATPLQPYFEDINSIVDIQGVQDHLAKYQLLGIEVLFSFYSKQDSKNSDRVIGKIGQKGLSLPDRLYYLDNNDRYQEIRASYLTHVTQMFKLLGDTDPAALSAAEVVLRLETQLAEGSNTPLENRDEETTYNLFDLTDLETLAPAFDWQRFFTFVGRPEPGDININQPRFIQTLNDMMTTVSVEEWKVFLRWKLVTSTAPFLSSEFENENFDFFHKKLQGVTEMTPRWERVLSATEAAMGEAVGELYVSRHFPPEAKERMVEMVDHLQKAMKNRITTLTWMDEVTKEKALLKLSLMTAKIGYPDHWRDYSNLDVGVESYLANVLTARSFQKTEEIAQIGKPVDRGRWAMTPQTVNAYFSPVRNEIVFPAAILQTPFFNLNADDAVNYGAIGMVIGHEISHGFDDQGRKFDGQGNLTDWWSAADKEEFSRKSQLLVDQYNNFSVSIAGESYFVDGRLTLGENIADVAGMTIAYDAYLLSREGKDAVADLDGFSDDQRFFISAAQIWRWKIQDDYLINMLKTNVHSPAEFRVNGAMFNVPAFYRAFDIKSDAALYRSEEQMPGLW